MAEAELEREREQEPQPAQRERVARRPGTHPGNQDPAQQQDEQRQHQRADDVPGRFTEPGIQQRHAKGTVQDRGQHQDAPGQQAPQDHAAPAGSGS